MGAQKWKWNKEQAIYFYLKNVKAPVLDFVFYHFFYSLKGVGRINHYNALPEVSDVILLSSRRFWSARLSLCEMFLSRAYVTVVELWTDLSLVTVEAT